MKTQKALIAACVAVLGLVIAAPANASCHHHKKHHDHYDHYGYGYSRPYAYRSYYRPVYSRPAYYSAPDYSDYCAPTNYSTPVYYSQPRVYRGVTISFGGNRGCYR